VVSSRRRKPSYWSRSAEVSKAGSIVAASKALRIARIDKRTASRNAALAFSIRCRVAGFRCRNPAPSEPDGTISRHPAQASAAWHPIRAWCA